MKQVKGNITEGKWLGEQISIDFGDGSPQSTKITVDGKPLDNVLAINIAVNADKRTTFNIILGD